MAFIFKAEKMPSPQKNRLPFLPRIGVVVDFGGTKYSYKYVSVLETMASIVTDGPITLSKFKKIITMQFKEIEFPDASTPQVVETTAKSRGTVTKTF